MEILTFRSQRSNAAKAEQATPFRPNGFERIKG